MKRTFPVNINGKVFYIDEDAYSLLQNYLDQLNSTFSGSEREEIVGDIEARISELFDERIAQGVSAIVYADVCRVIEIMGNPSQIGEQSDEESAPAEDTPAPDEQDATEKVESSPDSQESEAASQPRRLYRLTTGKVFGGVIGGLATYLGWDANIMRVLTVILALVTQLWPLVLVYLVAWMVIPPANTTRRVLEQQGTPVTIGNISQNVLSSIGNISQNVFPQQTPPPYLGEVKANTSNFLTDLLRGLGKIFVSILGLAGAAGAMFTVGFAIILAVALISYNCFHDIVLVSSLDWMYPNVIGVFSTSIPTIGIMAFLCLTMCFFVPCLAVAWAAATYIFDCKGATKATIISAMIIEVVFIAATIILFMFVNNMTSSFL